MREPNYIFLTNFAKFEELEIDTDSFYLAFSEQDLYDRMMPTMKKEWNSLLSGDGTVNL